ncbi:MFS general substrate transporter [Fistulina hepatica ATCC 64428]|uniref:MFS general substrate transporter n=1 Tax=Fistulina hepatica ATCC 64428 TaxID=1128425 RepID=A0A0D7AM65_9AGAR|nr:MFS general substrate transporter [Fistulina hepatica ATCC 64428]
MSAEKDSPRAGELESSVVPVNDSEKSGLEDVLQDDAIDPSYVAKAHILNEAIQAIGMGRYQWYLFVVTGFGWFVDNLYPIVISLILDPVVNEFHFQGPFLSLGQSIGLLLGAAFWGVGADIWGRRWSFNLTMLITGVFSIAAGASPDAAMLCVFAGLWSIGVGGNLPVDSAIFLEFVPGTHQYLLTVLSIWWAFGQLVGSLIAWPFMANLTCTTSDPCPRDANLGWRYFLFTMGGLMMLLWIIRFFLFKLYESPKYLMGRGRDREAVDVVWKVAQYNGKTSNLTVERLDAVGSYEARASHFDTSAKGALRRSLARLELRHVKPLFASRKIAYSTTLLIIIWAFIGLAFPLYNSFITYYLETRGATFGDGSLYITYRNQVIISVIGVPGALLAGWMVELPLLGRKGTLSVSTLLTGAFILASTTARNSNALLGWNCAYSFTSNIMYGVLYALSPELFPTKDRGTGNALVAIGNRIFGIMSPIIAMYANLATSAPIYVSGVLFLGTGFIALLLPFEPRGKTSL